VVSVSGKDYGRERFADTFVGESLVASDDPANTTLVVHPQRHFGVSLATLRMRLLQAKLITEATPTSPPSRR
jgi:hypothetical protein